MFRNYLKVALRSLLKYKGHSFINIAGLSIGMAACLLLFLWIQDELSYDRYHEYADRIFRVVSQYEYNGEVNHSASIPAPIAPALIDDFPWIQKAIRFARNRFLIKCGDTIFNEEVFFTDPDIFDVFTFPLVMGNPDTALKNPSTILISEEMRNKYFGDENPLGKTIRVGEEYDYKITGVFKNIPGNSHFRFHFLSSVLNYGREHLSKWGVLNYFTYILIKKDFPRVIDTFHEKMPQFVEKYRGKDVIEMYKLTYLLQPLTSIHLHSSIGNDFESNRDIDTVYFFSAIALLILLIACLNYINLATARFTTRCREAGLRKVLGATQGQLVGRFLGESFLLTSAALPPGVLLAEAFLPLFNSLIGKELVFHYFSNVYLLSGLIGIFFCVGFVSGIVPALFTSTFQPTAVLKGMFRTGGFIPILRRSLVVFQFSISIVFIICTLIISNQLHYMRTKNPGFNKNYVVNIKTNLNEEALLKYETIKYEFSQHPNVTAVSASSFFPGRPRWNNNYWLDGASPNEYGFIGCISADYDFIDTFQLNLIEGRGFSKGFPTDTDSAFIINEAAVKEFGWKSAIGQNLKVSADWKKGTVIGVVQDFHFNSLHKKIQPVVLYIDPASFDYFSVRINPGNVSQTLDFLKTKWEALVHDEPFVFSFLDEDIGNLYKAEAKLGTLFIVVSSLAVFVACLGLFGLAAFTTEQRTKEIGIRKVFGASVGKIVLLLSKEFTRWVLISNIIAWPIAWYAMNQWIQNFEYRITILPWTFLLSGLLTFVIALMTVSFKSVRAASSNPVEALRYE